MRTNKKDMDLLSAYYRKNEPSKYLPIIKLAIFPLCAAIVVVGVTVFAKLQTSNINAQSAQVDASIAEYNNKIDTVGRDGYNNFINIQSNTEALTTLIENIRSYPKATTDMINIFLNTMGDGTSLTNFYYADGTMSVQFMSSNVLAPEQLVRNLRNSGHFVNVSYSGYETQEQTYGADGSTTTDEENSVTVTSYVYSVDCVLKGGA